MSKKQEVGPHDATTEAVSKKKPASGRVEVRRNGPWVLLPQEVEEDAVDPEGTV